MLRIRWKSFKKIQTDESQSKIASKLDVLSNSFQEMSAQNNRQFATLHNLVNKLPAYKMRKIQLHSPFNTAEILTDYSLGEEVKFFEKFVSFNIL